jgi:hypothetical protein
MRAQISLYQLVFSHDIELGRIPQLLRRGQGSDLQVCPPGLFVGMPVQLMMVSPTEWHREFIANLTAKSSLLCEFQVVRIARGLFADEARLASHIQ